MLQRGKMLNNKKLYVIIVILILIMLWIIVPVFLYNYLELKQNKEEIKTNEYVINTSKIDFEKLIHTKTNVPVKSFLEKRKLKNLIWEMENNSFEIRNYLQIEYRETNSSEIKNLLNNYNNYWEFMFLVKNDFKKNKFINPEMLQQIKNTYDIKNVKALKKYQPALNSDIYAMLILYYMVIGSLTYFYIFKKKREVITEYLIYWLSK
jgi:hypothetical protein